MLTFTNTFTLPLKPVSEYLKSQFVAAALRKLSAERPMPPKIQTDAGIQENTSDPQYREADARWRTRCTNLATLMLLEAAADLPDLSPWQATLAETMARVQADQAQRDAVLQLAGVPSDDANEFDALLQLAFTDTQRVILLFGVAGNRADLNTLVRALWVSSLDEEVGQVAESFRDDVQRSEPVELPSAAGQAAA